MALRVNYETTFLKEEPSVNFFSIAAREMC